MQIWQAIWQEQPQHTYLQLQRCLVVAVEKNKDKQRTLDLLGILERKEPFTKGQAIELQKLLEPRHMKAAQDRDIQLAMEIAAILIGLNGFIHSEMNLLSEWMSLDDESKDKKRRDSSPKDVQRIYR